MNSEISKDIWVFAEQTDGRLAPVAGQLLGEGARLLSDMPAGAQLCALVAGDHDDAASASSEAIAYGASTVYSIESPLLKDYTTDGYAKAVTAAIEEYRPDIILYGATPVGRDLAPRIAARLGLGLTADCTRLDLKASDYLEFAQKETTMDTSGLDLDDTHLKQTKPSFGGKLMATMICPDARPQMATVRAGVMDAPEPDYNRSGEIISVNADINDEDIRIKVVSREVLESESASISDAEVIVAGGRGLGSAEGFKLLQQLADKAGGGVQLLQLRQGHILNLAGAIAGAVDLLIVDDDQLAVLRQVNVQLNTIHTQLDSFLEGQHGILRISAAEAAMGKNLTHNSSSFLSES